MPDAPRPTAEALLAQFRELEPVERAKFLCRLVQEAGAKEQPLLDGLFDKDGLKWARRFGEWVYRVILAIHQEERSKRKRREMEKHSRWLDWKKAGMSHAKIAAKHQMLTGEVFSRDTVASAIRRYQMFLDRTAADRLRSDAEIRKHYPLP